MDGPLWWLAQNTLTIAVAIAAVALLCRLMPRRPALHHLLWLVVLLKFLTPPVVVWPWTVDDLAQRWHSAGHFPPQAAEQASPGTAAIPATPEGDLSDLMSDEAPELLPPPRRIDIEAAIAEPLMTEVSMTETSLAPAADLTGGEIAEAGTLSKLAQPADLEDSGGGWRWLSPALFTMWIAGAVLATVWQARRLRRFHRLARCALPAPRPLVQEVKAIADRLRIRPPPALVADSIATPLVWSLLRLVLLWPARLAGEVGSHRGVIAHELAHVKRRDHWVAWLVLVAGCVWWWNPLFWLVRRRLHETAEMACDALALDLSPDGRQRYAELLLEWSQWSPHATPAPAVLGASFGARRTFRRRLAMILNDRISSKVSWPGLALATLLALASLPSWAWGQATEPASAADPATQPAAATETKKPAEPALDPGAAAPRPGAPRSLAERLRQLNAAGRALDEERTGRKAERKVDVHQVAKGLQQARREMRLIRTGGPVDAEKVAKAQRALADLRAVMRESKRSPELMVTETYLHLLSRRPSEDELRAFQKQLALKPDSDGIYDDVFWAVLNSKEFLEGAPAAQVPGDASKPAIAASEPAAADDPRAQKRSLEEEVARLTAQLKLQEDKLRKVEAERAALTKDLLDLAARVHELQNAVKKTPAPATRTPSPSDGPRKSTKSNSFFGGLLDPSPKTSATNVPGEPAIGASEPAANNTVPATAAAPASARASSDGGVDVINLATAYVDAQAAAELAQARAERVEKLRGKGFISQEQIEADLRSAAVAQRKFKLLRAIAEAELAAAKAELDAVVRAIEEGVLPKSKRVSIEARIRVLGLILEPADKAK